MAKLMAGVSLRQRLGSFGHTVAGQYLHTLRTSQRMRIQAQQAGQFGIHLDQARGRYRCG
jgi:hypothetical protein